MNEELTATLREIADLMRRSEERREADSASARKVRDDLALKAEESRKRLEIVTAQSDAFQQGVRTEVDDVAKETREFQTKMLTELTRHNDLLERIARHLEGAGQL